MSDARREAARIVVQDLLNQAVAELEHCMMWDQGWQSLEHLLDALGHVAWRYGGFNEDLMNWAHDCCWAAWRIMEGCGQGWIARQDALRREQLEEIEAREQWRAMVRRYHARF